MHVSAHMIMGVIAHEEIDVLHAYQLFIKARCLVLDRDVHLVPLSASLGSDNSSKNVLRRSLARDSIIDMTVSAISYEMATVYKSILANNDGMLSI